MLLLQDLLLPTARGSRSVIGWLMATLALYSCRIFAHLVVFCFWILEFRRTRVLSSSRLSEWVQPSSPPEYEYVLFVHIFSYTGFDCSLPVFLVFLCSVLCPVSSRRLFIAYVLRTWFFFFAGHFRLEKRKVLAVFWVSLGWEKFRLNTTAIGREKLRTAVSGSTH